MSRAPRSWPKELTDLPFAHVLAPAAEPLDPEGSYDTVHFDQAAWDEPDLRSAHFLECALTRITVQGGKFRRARFTDTWLKDVRMTLCDLAETGWTDVTFAGGVVAGAVAFSSRLSRVTFAGCKLDSVNFRDAKLTDVRFADCLLRDVDFAGATLRRVSFGGSTLTRVDFSRVKLEKADLRDAELGLIITPDSLRGAIVTTGQLATIAPALAEALGIIVDDDLP
jgi:uncharacterized protein YjbI with pentapeptide repeats